MFAAPQIFQDAKENIKSALPSKNTNARKGLKSCSSNNFTHPEPANRLKSEKSVSKCDPSSGKFSSREKENSKSKIKIVEDIQADHKVEVPWPDEIEEMYIDIETEDLYEDILPMCERIQKKDVDNLFLDWTSSMCADEPSHDELPSPLEVSIDFDIPSPTLPELYVPPFEDYDLAPISLSEFAL